VPYGKFYIEESKQKTGKPMKFKVLVEKVSKVSPKHPIYPIPPPWKIL
jgi:hypothetical protein